MEKVEKYKKLISPILERYAIKKAALFGSVAKNKANTNVDLLIGPSAGFTLFRMLQMGEEISAAIQRKVELVEYAALKSSIKNEVLSSAIKIL